MPLGEETASRGSTLHFTRRSALRASPVQRLWQEPLKKLHPV